MNEIENDRQELLADLKENGHDQNFEIGSHGHHEATDRTHLVTSMFQDHVVDHPFIVLHPELYAKARQILDDLADLYQSVGAKEYASPVVVYHGVHHHRNPDVRTPT